MDKSVNSIDYLATMEIPTRSRKPEGEIPTFFLKYLLK